MLAPCPRLWDLSDMPAPDELEGVRLYDAFMALKPPDLAETDWAERAGVNRGFFGNLKTKAKNPRRDTVRKLLSYIGKSEADLDPEAPPAPKAGRRIIALEPDQPPTRSADGGDTAAVLRLDLSYAMGPGTNLDDSHVEGEPVYFDIAFLRQLTPSTADRLRIVNGSGDSMLPTIHDREELIIDLNQTKLNMQDRIWAISLFGAGALKRLRTVGADRVLVISDNPDVPDQEVAANDIVIAGRLVGSIKRH